MNPHDPVTRLRDTQAAFDSVAADYDGPRGNNSLIQDMRHEMWRWLDRTFAPNSRLIDLGCGTGLDAVRLAHLGHRITATDSSPQMIARTADRAARESLSERIDTRVIGAQELRRIEGEAVFDGAYSNLGPLNCVPELAEVSDGCARLLKPGGALVFTVVGRICPWEMAHYARLGNWPRLKIRFARHAVAVSMNQHTIWTRYYTPREFYRPFARDFSLQHHRGLCIFAPPPYLTWLKDRHPQAYEASWRLDKTTAGWPLLRSVGDHFLIVMRRR